MSTSGTPPPHPNPPTPPQPGTPPPPAAASQDTPDERMMRRALELARHAASIGEVPVGAVVYLHEADGSARVIGEGFNQRESLGDPAAHAELLAIREAAFTLGDWRLNRCTLAVTLEPCPMCAGLIVNARVGRLIYGCADPKAGAVETLYRITEDARLNHRIAAVGGVLKEDAAGLLREFFRGLRAGPAEPRS